MSISPGFVIDEDMFAPNVISDPYTYYGRLREHEPVHWNDLHKVWVVTCYEEITWLTLHPEIFSSSVPQKDPLPPYPPIAPEDQKDFEYVQRQQSGRIVTADPPPHRDMRSTLRKFFTPGALEKWRPMVRNAVDELLDAVGDQGRMDVMADFAVPLPLLVISEMLAVPAADRPYLRSLAEHLLVGPRVSPGRMHEIAGAMRAMNEYAAPLVEQRLREPGDDLISLLAQGEQSGVYTREQVLQNIAFLVVAGHETSTNLTANGLVALANHPAQWALLRSDPDQWAGPATEECLRYDPPVKSIERIVNTEVELGGQHLAQLQRVRWFIASGNRDPKRFTDPDNFDITRSPNPHLGFGNGIHLCLGATLARMEAQETFAAMAQRFDQIRVETDPLEWAPAAHLRSLKALSISWASGGR
jgi:cytochrome P450